ncbi:MAG: beta-ketoacyl synthase N-terminal-like domain-containing protein, partial [Deltaproteobacteria bacterium]
RDPGTPRRAAISAFGFGGINGHVLLEEWVPDTKAVFRHSAIPKPLDIAIVGMDACFGSFQTLRAFQEAVLSGKSGIRKRPARRWKGCDPIAAALLNLPDIPGGYIEEITLELSDLHIPPNEIPDILLQHLLMLKVSHRAMADAGYTSRKLRPRMGAIIGMGFDMEATDYHVRWNLGNTHADWLKQAGVSLNDDQRAAWLKYLKDDFGPALNASRTLGALAGVVASRVAREFGMGAPSFTVSANAASGFSALDIAARLLQRNEADAMLVGAVDMAGDVRSILIAHGISPFSPSGVIRPFDRSADGALPGEGSAAVILKRLDQAIADGNRIYAVIKGAGSACAKSANGQAEYSANGQAAYSRSLRQSLDEAGKPSPAISFFEAHGSGQPVEDQLEAKALNAMFQEDSSACVAIGSVKSIIGHTGAAAGMASLIKTCLCLYQEILPPLVGYTQAPDTAAGLLWSSTHFHFPAFPQYWARNRKDGPRLACCAALTSTTDGLLTCSHLILEGHETANSRNAEMPEYRNTEITAHRHTGIPAFQHSSRGDRPVAPTSDLDRRRPLGHATSGLFIVEGPDRDALIRSLNLLDLHIRTVDGSQLTIHSSPFTVNGIEQSARSWFQLHPLAATKASVENQFESPPSPCGRGLGGGGTHVVSLIAETPEQLIALIADARDAVLSGTSRRINGRSGIVYTPFVRTAKKYSGELAPTSDTKVALGCGDPREAKKYSGESATTSREIAFVFPGSGNHYVGMGRTLAATWPEILRKMDAETPELKTQLVPAAYVPFRQSWASGWETEAMNAISADPLIPIFGQVVHGSVMTRLVKTFGIIPQAVIGYSLGETAGLFALGAWPDRGEMLSRLAKSSLFHTELAGPCNAARKAWNIAPFVPFSWKVAVVNRPSDIVKSILPLFPLARLLIVNSPDECVIGGDRPDVEGVIAALKCEAVYLDGVVTVHCDAAIPVRKAYRALHLFPTVQPPNIRFYSCALNRAYSLNTESAADSITQQAISGFDFTATIRQAYSDGVRIFLEMGPHSSCTRMITRILEDRPHLAISASSRGEDEVVSILKFLGTLAAERIFIDLEPLYGENTGSAASEVFMSGGGREQIIQTGGNPFSPKFPQISDSACPKSQAENTVTPALYASDMLQAVVQNAKATADAHESFLRFSTRLSQEFADGFALQARLLQQQLRQMTDDREPFSPSSVIRHPSIAYPRSLCLEFAIGSAAIVLGPEFAEADTYPARVRLPDEPLMLVDRILSVDGQKGSLGPGRVVTEHDVVPGAWYLDGGHAPVCISVEAGQADLFLCAWLGIDLQVKGLRTYRLLDASVQFHRGLPLPGDVIRY